MNIKRITAPDTRQAMRQVKETLGEDAVILSNKPVAEGVEIVAAVDLDDAALQRRAESAGRPATKPVESPRPQPSRPEPEAPSSLRAVAEAASGPSEAARSAGATRPAGAGRAADEGPGAAEGPGRARRNRGAAESAEVSALKSELSTLRRLMENQLSVMEWGQMSRQNPLRAALLEQLMGMGLGTDLAARLADGVNEREDLERALGETRELLGEALEREERSLVDQGGVVAVVGPTGVGKTTTVAKLAARHIMRYGPGSVALVTTDNFRIGAVDQLRNFARILDVPIHSVGGHHELRDVLDRLFDRRLVLIDTAGMSQRDMRLVEQFATLQDVHAELRTYLVLSANTQLAALDEATRSFRRVNLSGCIITKVDEAASLGGVLATLIKHRLPVAYLGVGQRVPEDLEEACPARLVERACELSDAEPESADGEVLALAFGGGRSAMPAN